MDRKSIVTALVIVTGLGLVSYAFLANSSPYVDVQQAKQSKADNLHVAGEIVPGTLASGAGSASFTLKDEKGQTIRVAYSGSPVANLATATKVVAVGGMKGDSFQSHKLLVKCPSKYESEPKVGA